MLANIVDIRTHIDKGHTCERTRNMSGSLAGADDSCAKDEVFWDHDDVYRRMEFSLKCAYAHGHQPFARMSGPVQGAIAWPVFEELREAWRGRIELQGVSLAILRFFRDEKAGAALADQVKAHGGILGAAVLHRPRGILTTSTPPAARKCPHYWIQYSNWPTNEG